jgi:hypothetical protein
MFQQPAGYAFVSLPQTSYFNWAKSDADCGLCPCLHGRFRQTDGPLPHPTFAEPEQTHLRRSVRSWQEVWLINICGHRLNVPQHLYPGPKGPGTSFSISSDKITEAR